MGFLDKHEVWKVKKFKSSYSAIGLVKGGEERAQKRGQILNFTLFKRRLTEKGRIRTLMFLPGSSSTCK